MISSAGRRSIIAASSVPNSALVASARIDPATRRPAFPQAVHRERGSSAAMVTGGNGAAARIAGLLMPLS
jgi:hypothetical protein